MTQANAVLKSRVPDVPTPPPNTALAHFTGKLALETDPSDVFFEYTLPHNLQRLKSRGLGGKRSLALREFALGLESLERFVHREPLRRVHECVFGVLALESEPVDPRL